MTIEKLTEDSQLLNPTHRWLFNKIKLVEEREQAVAAAFEVTYGASVLTLHDKMQEKHGPYMADSPIEKLIGDDIPADDFITGAIARAETREAEFLKGLIEAHGEDAKELALKVSFEYGKEYGTTAKKEYERDDPHPDYVYTVLKNYYLDGDPSKNESKTDLTRISVGEFVERHTKCSHNPYWQAAGLDAEFACKYIRSYLEGFTDAYSTVALNTIIKDLDGKQVCEHWFTTVQAKEAAKVGKE